MVLAQSQNPSAWATPAPAPSIGTQSIGPKNNSENPSSENQRATTDGIKSINTKILSILAFSALYALALLYVALAGPNSSLLFPAISLGLVSLFGFMRQGGALINASSATSYAILLFVAFPAAYHALGLYQPYITPSSDALTIALTLNFCLQILIFALGKRVLPRSYERLGIRTGQPFTWAIFGLAAFGAALLATGLGAVPVAQGLGLVSILAVGFATAFGPRLNLFLAVVLVVLVVLYTQFVFTGFGRLTLGVIGLSLAMMVSYRYRNLWSKIGLLLVTMPALLYFSAQRLAFLRDLRGASADESEGLGSAVDPFLQSATIVDAMANSRIEPAYGETIVVAGLVWVPRSVWESKPDGFGSQIVPVTQPHLSGVEEHSGAGTLAGEAVWNFGLFGAPVLLVFTVVLIRFLDKYLDVVALRSASPAYAVPIFLSLVVVSAATAHLIWGGFFTAAARSLGALAVLAALSLILYLLRSAGQRQANTSSSKVMLQPQHHM